MVRSNVGSQVIRWGSIASCMFFCGVSNAIATWVAMENLGFRKAMNLLPCAYLATYSLAAVCLELPWLGRFGFGAANCLGLFWSFPSFIATQSMKGNETVGELAIAFGLWFVMAFFMASALSLGIFLRRGWAVLLAGILGFCFGAAANGALVGFALTQFFREKLILKLFAAFYFTLPAFFASLAISFVMYRLSLLVIPAYPTRNPSKESRQPCE